MEIGIDSFASVVFGTTALSNVDVMEQLLQRIAVADGSGLDVFGIGEHHKKEFQDSAPVVILATAAAGIIRAGRNIGTYIDGCDYRS